ncbi:MAG: hypothetical protein RL173_1109 [Fibrobacterota bacterium]|jgi:hypothetical protein
MKSKMKLPVTSFEAQDQQGDTQESFDRLASLYLIDESENNYPHPNWDIWGKFRYASLRDAISLAVNISPALSTNCSSTAAARIHEKSPSAWSCYSGLAIIAENRIDEILDSESSRRTDFLGNIVNLERFGAFVESLGDPYSLPMNFPRERGPKVISETYMTAPLRRLCDVACQFYQQSGGGKQSTLAGELAKATWLKPSDQQLRAMETLAGLFRPDEERKKDKRSSRYLVDNSDCEDGTSDGNSTDL